MAEKQSVAGLGARPRKQLNALDNFTLAVKPAFKQKSLNEILADLSATELEQLQKYGRIIYFVTVSGVLATKRSWTLFLK